MIGSAARAVRAPEPEADETRVPVDQGAPDLARPPTYAREHSGKASVVLEHVHVNFPIYNGFRRSLRHTLVNATTGGRILSDTGDRICIEALDDISFNLSHGDRLGLIGHNGAGKTTLLRVLAGIYIPPEGVVRVEGRVAPIFDAGLGIDLESTGYENIRLRGLYLGFTRAQMEAKAEEIAEFTELGSFLQMPVRTYSAGMQARLAFAISTSIEPEILLLDEGIAAGDAAFLQKANQRLHEFIESSGIMVLASHSDPLIRAFCNKAMLLEHGRIVGFGPVDEVLAAYRG
jgi:ABC-type polysaccharide/polyol phosphate transport system ATPase subunit